jgi:hypothetical protein
MNVSHGRKLKFSAIGDLMLKTSEKPNVPKASRKRFFGQREKAPRAGLYARVSTHDQQTLPMQLAAMRDYARKRGSARSARNCWLRREGAKLTLLSYGGLIAGGGLWWIW